MAQQGTPLIDGAASAARSMKEPRMATNTVWIVVAVIAALIVIAALVWVGRNRQISRKTAKADEIREEVRQEHAKVQRREALADETAAKARAAQAEAEAKAAEAARLEENAAKHRDHATTRREELDEKWSEADSLDPRVENKT
jgi:biopolymer transport protein ExbB/TolQ